MLWRQSGRKTAPVEIERTASSHYDLPIFLGSDLQIPLFFR
jgi:hypothetical protein